MLLGSRFEVVPSTPVDVTRAAPEELVIVTVRKALEGDRERWLELRAALLPATSLEAHDAAIGRALAGSLRRTALVHERGPHGTLDGFVEVSRDSDGSGIARIEALFVASDARRRGIATKLLESAGQWAAAAGASELRCDWPVADEPAHASLLSLGFGETGRRVHFARKLHPAMALDKPPSPPATTPATRSSASGPARPTAAIPDRRLLHGLVIAAGVACLLSTDVFSGDLIRGGLLPLIDVLFVVYLMALLVGRQYRRRTDSSERSIRLFDAAPPDDRRRME